MVRSTIMMVAIALAMAAGALEIDGIAARVGSDAILKSDVAMEMQRANLPESAYRQILSEMIDRKLILKAAADAKMTMQEWVIESRIREIIKKAFGGDRNQLMDKLAQQKVSYPEWHARMKEDMIVQAMRWNVVDKNITASPQAMRREYAEHPDRYAQQRKTTVAVILLDPNRKDKRDEISAQLGGTDFSELADKYSFDTAHKGGIWKDVDPADYFLKEICEEIEQMPRGTISHWIEANGGWSYLIKKIADNPSGQRTFEEAYDDIEENVKEELAKKAYDAWIERLRDETYIKVY